MLLLLLPLVLLKLMLLYRVKQVQLYALCLVRRWTV